VAPGTVRGYKKEWVKWLTFARRHEYHLAPPRPSDLEDYLTSEVGPRGSVAIIDSISALFNWHCGKVGYDSPFLNKRIVLIVKGMKRLLRKPTVPRLPFQRTHIRRFMRFLKGSFRHWRAAVVMATCFADFLHFSKVLNVRLEDLTLSGNNLRFRVRKAKNHRLNFDVCLPVGPKSIGSFVLDFLQRGLKWRPGEIGFLCCQLEGGNFLPQLPISYSALHSSCKDLIEAVGLDPTKYSTHSAKRGSATAAVMAGCTDAEVTALGRWKSAETGKRYVHGSEELGVSFDSSCATAAQAATVEHESDRP
jgi:integrase